MQLIITLQTAHIKKIHVIHVNIMGEVLGVIELHPVQDPVLQSKSLSGDAQSYISLHGH